MKNKIFTSGKIIFMPHLHNIKCDCGEKNAYVIPKSENNKKEYVCFNCVKERVFLLCELCKEEYLKVKFESTEWYIFPSMIRKCKHCHFLVKISRQISSEIYQINKFINKTKNRYPLWKNLHLSSDEEFDLIHNKIKNNVNPGKLFNLLIKKQIIFKRDQTQKLVDSIYDIKDDSLNNKFYFNNAILTSSSDMNKKYGGDSLPIMPGYRDILYYEKLFFLWNNIRISMSSAFNNNKCYVCFEVTNSFDCIIKKSTRDYYNYSCLMDKIIENNKGMICSFCRKYLCYKCRSKYFDGFIINKKCPHCRNKFEKYFDYILTEENYWRAGKKNSKFYELDRSKKLSDFIKLKNN